MPVSRLGKKMDIFPQQSRAEGIHCFDLRLIHPKQLSLQMPVFRLLGKSPIQFSRDLPP